MYGAWLAPGTYLPATHDTIFLYRIHTHCTCYYAYSCPYIFYELVYTVRARSTVWMLCIRAYTVRRPEYMYKSMYVCM